MQTDRHSHPVIAVEPADAPMKEVECATARAEGTETLLSEKASRLRRARASIYAHRASLDFSAGAASVGAGRDEGELHACVSHFIGGDCEGFGEPGRDVP